VKKLAELQRHLPRVKPWVAAAVLLAMCLLGYYAALGMRYWKASEQTASLTSQIHQLSGKGSEGLPEEKALAAELESQEQRWEKLYSLFSYPETDDLIAIVSATAQETPVDLMSVAVGDPQQKTRGGIQYQTQPMTITLQGEAPDIYRFLSLLYQEVPVTAVSGFRITGLEGAPSAQVHLLFHLSPQATSENRGAD